LAASDLRFAPSPALGKEVRPVPDRPRHKTGFYSMLGRAGQTLERRLATDRSGTFPKWKRMLCAHTVHGVETERRLALGRWMPNGTAIARPIYVQFIKFTLRVHQHVSKTLQEQGSESEETGAIGMLPSNMIVSKALPVCPEMVRCKDAGEWRIDGGNGGIGPGKKAAPPRMHQCHKNKLVNAARSVDALMPL